MNEGTILAAITVGPIRLGAETQTRTHRPRKALPSPVPFFGLRYSPLLRLTSVMGN